MMIYTQNIERLSGTRGFKYSLDYTYTLQDEIFAYLATIYYIEMGELLIDGEEFQELSEAEDIFEEINSHVRDKLEFIDRGRVKNFLSDILGSLKNNEKLDCSILRERFQKSKPKERRYKPFLFIGAIVVVGLLLFSLLSTTPSCDKAFFIDDDTIEVIEHGGNIKFYHYSNGKFHRVGECRP